METFYNVFENGLAKVHPLFKYAGYRRLEKPIAWLEKNVKSVLFDCKMCGQCVLSDTGMSCPMNCPKQLRNGPCGGVRADGYCEVEPDMKCVWVLASEGAVKMRHGDNILKMQFPVDRRLEGRSSWLRVAQQRSGQASGVNK